MLKLDELLMRLRILLRIVISSENLKQQKGVVTNRSEVQELNAPQRSTRHVLDALWLSVLMQNNVGSVYGVKLKQYHLRLS